MILTELRGWLGCVERSPSLFRTVFLRPRVYVRSPWSEQLSWRFHGPVYFRTVLVRIKNTFKLPQTSQQSVQT